MSKKTKKAKSSVTYDEKSTIWVKGARLHNLKDVEVAIPKYAMTTVTGLSGSGKSSLIFDTLFAEGQRRYVESLSAYARQFLARMKKPDVDFIKGLCPAIAVEQRTASGSSRSTVGSMTELYDLLRVMYARIGITYSPISGEVVSRDRVEDVVDYVAGLSEGTRLLIMAPMSDRDGERPIRQQLQLLLQKGYHRLYLDDEMVSIEDTIEALSSKALDMPLSSWDADVYLLVDRLVLTDEQEDTTRIADSIQTAMAESDGYCVIQELGGEQRIFSTRFERDGIVFPEVNPHLFNYNNSYGACPSCEGFGTTIGIAEYKVIPDPTRSLIDGAIACWRGSASQSYLNEVFIHAEDYGINIHVPYEALSTDAHHHLWHGSQDFNGIYQYFERLEQESYKIQNRVILSRYRGRAICRTCGGYRVREEACYTRIGTRHIGELLKMSLESLRDFIEEHPFTEVEQSITERLLYEIKSRLDVLNKIGLGYLSLDRPSYTLSGGEAQRIQLSRLLGSNLADSLYILDEPSIGLHPQDTEALVDVLHELRDLGNTVVVIEHEEAVIRRSDHIIDMGPGAGQHGGTVLYAGAYKHFIKKAKTTTAAYLRGDQSLSRDSLPKKAPNKIKLYRARHHNLQGIDVTIPLQRLTVVCGVSGSGKSSLIHGILYPELQRHLGLSMKHTAGLFDRMEGDMSLLTDVQYVDQNAINRSTRSNPVTYIKAYDAIRQLFMKQHLAKVRGYKAKHFSFNVDGGRCETCKGDGNTVVEMQFLADIQLVCDTCGGKRFKDEILEVKYRGKSIHDVLCMSVEEALTFFADERPVHRSLEPLMHVGLDYVQLGQTTSTLSGGEAQRLKLAFYLARESSSEHILFLFDEPTTGLHFHDIQRLLTAFDLLIAKGHSVVVIEHNTEVIRHADHVIEIGPGGGIHGGQLLYQGDVKGLMKCKKSVTRAWL